MDVFSRLLALLAILAFPSFSQAIKISNDQIAYDGRFLNVDGTYRANWPGSAFRFSFQSQNLNSPVKISVLFGDGGSSSYNYYVKVFVDCLATEKYLIAPNSTTIDFTYSATDTTPTIHEISFMKVTEAANGNAVGLMEVVNVEVENAVVNSGSPGLSRCASSGKKLLFIGDSLTAAYGVAGTYPCSFSAYTEDVSEGYAYLTARAVYAEYQIIAWSGKGMVRNYGDPVPVDPTNAMPCYYNRTIATISATNSNNINNNNDYYYDPRAFPADIIIINLGTNDYSTEPQPSDEQFINGYVDFLLTIQRDYPAAQIVGVCAPHLPSLTGCQNIFNAIEKVERAWYIEMADSCYESMGCDYHPDTKSQENMANALIPLIHDLLYTI
jgi:lysophospholipase L1-like esterase